MGRGEAGIGDGGLRFGTIEECVVGGQELLFAGHAMPFVSPYFRYAPHIGGRLVVCVPGRKKKSHTRTEGNFPRYLGLVLHRLGLGAYIRPALNSVPWG